MVRTSPQVSLADVLPAPKCLGSFYLSPQFHVTVLTVPFWWFYCHGLHESGARKAVPSNLQRQGLPLDPHHRPLILWHRFVESQAQTGKKYRGILRPHGLVIRQNDATELEIGSAHV